MTALPAWSERPQHKPRVAMNVKVKTPFGERQYQGLFSTTFDAYDDALEKFGELALRIEVNCPLGGSK